MILIEILILKINFGTSKYTRNVKAKGVGALVSYYVEENYTINVVGGVVNLLVEKDITGTLMKKS